MPSGMKELYVHYERNVASNRAKLAPTATQDGLLGCIPVFGESAEAILGARNTECLCHVRDLPGGDGNASGDASSNFHRTNGCIFD